MDEFEKLSNEAKQAWRRGFDLAYTRNWRFSRSLEGRRDQATDDPRAEKERVANAVAKALEEASSAERKSMLAIKSGEGVRMVVMDPMSVEAVIDELGNLETDECREALGEGFLRGMIAKAEAAEIGAAGTEEPEASPPLMN